jgi:hypothetical protein
VTARFRLLVSVLAAAVMAAVTASAADAQIKNVLPHLLDEKGRISVSPGLFERDAYQQILRQNPGRISGVRYDVQWRAPGRSRDNLKIRLQLRTAKRGAEQPLVIEAPVNERHHWGGWSSVKLDPTLYREAGEVLAWRAVLLDGDQEIAEQKSFLW